MQGKGIATLCFLEFGLLVSGQTQHSVRVYGEKKEKVMEFAKYYEEEFRDPRFSSLLDSPVFFMFVLVVMALLV